MSKWIKFKDQLPPLGIPLVIYKPNKCDQIALTKMGYTFSRLDDKCFPIPATEKQIKDMEGYWLELPE